MLGITVERDIDDKAFRVSINFPPHKLGHRMQDCRKRMKSEQRKRETGMTTEEIADSDAFTLIATVYEKKHPRQKHHY